MPSMDNFRSELSALLTRARSQGRPHVEVNSGELHRSLGGYPGSAHRMPMCCNAMREAMTSGDEVIFAPDSGDGASLTIKYRLSR